MDDEVQKESPNPSFFQREEAILTFQSTHQAIGGEKTLIEASIPVRVMGLPGAIQAGCGLCLRIDPEDLAESKSLLAKKGIWIEGCYLKTFLGGKTVYVAIP